MGCAFGVAHGTRNLKDSHRQECLCYGVSQTFLSVFRHLSDKRAVPGQVSGEVRIALVDRDTGQGAGPRGHAGRGPAPLAGSGPSGKIGTPGTS